MLQERGTFNGGVKPVVYRLHRSLRHRWRSTLFVAAAVAVVSGAVLTLAAGARRTSAAPDAFTAAVGGDIDGTVTQPFGPPRTPEVAALPGVLSVEPITFLFVDVVDADHPSATDTICFTGTWYGSRLVAGRLPDPSNPREFIADRAFVAAHDARLGDRYQLTDWTRDQVEQGVGFVDGLQKPLFEAELVGIVESSDALSDRNSKIVLSRAVLDTDVGAASTLMAVRLRAGVTTDAFRSELDALPDGTSLTFDTGPLIGAPVRNAVEAQARGIWLMVLVAVVASVVALGQLLSRHARLLEAERNPLAALGFTDGQLAGESMSRAAVPAVIGVAVGVVLAIATSGWFPAGFVHVLEPSPGLRADFLVLALGGSLLLLAVLAWVGVALIFARHRSARLSPSLAPSLASESIARRAPSPAAAIGVRFALTSNEGSGRSATGTLVALAIIVAGLVGATTFAVSLDRLVSEPRRFGSNYDFATNEATTLSADDIRSALEGDPDIAGLMILSSAQVRVGDASVGLVGVGRVRGELAPRLLAGRLPSGPDEVALGRVTAGQLHVHVGSELAFAGSGGQGDYHVVGLVVVPGIAEIDGAGLGGVVTPEGLKRLEPAPSSNMAAVVLRAGAPPGTQQRVAALVGPQESGLQEPPSAIVNVARVRLIPGLLAVLLAALALLTTVHALVVSIQSRRRDLAVLRALGAGPRWIARAVHWQATVLGAAPLLLGVPLGSIAGAAVFRSFTNRIGAVPDAAVPVLLVLATIVGLVAAANLAAVVPARRARRVATAQLLRDE